VVVVATQAEAEVAAAVVVGALEVRVVREARETEGALETEEALEAEEVQEAEAEVGVLPVIPEVPREEVPTVEEAVVGPVAPGVEVAAAVPTLVAAAFLGGPITMEVALPMSTPMEHFNLITTSRFLKTTVIPAFAL
jgi:hypothetical protein